MTILTLPLIAVVDVMNLPVVNDAQLQIEPQTLLVEDYRSMGFQVLPDEFLARDRVLRDVLLPRTLRVIGTNVFSRMQSLERVDLSETAVESIGDEFLHETMSLESCSFPPTLRRIGWNFLFRTSVKRIDLFHTLVEVLPPEFLCFTPVELLLVPPTLQWVSIGALQMTRLRRLDWSHTRLTRIDNWVLGESPLDDLRLPSTLQSVAFSAFEDTPLRRMWVGEKEVPWVNEHLLDPEVRELSLPFCVTSMEEGSLNETQLQSVDLSFANLITIDHTVLCDNPCLEHVRFPRVLRYIRSSVLNGNLKLRLLDLRGTRVQAIGDDFLFETPIEEIWFPDTLRLVGNRFLFGARVTTVDLSKTLLTSIGTDFLQQCDQLQTLLLPEWVIDIPDNLPCPGRTAEAVTLPRSITYVGSFTFRCAPLLQLMDLSQTEVKYLPDRFLSEAPKLFEVRLPTSLQLIGCHVFARTSLRELDLRHTQIQSIGAGFCEFSLVTRLYVPPALADRQPELRGASWDRHER